MKLYAYCKGDLWFAGLTPSGKPKTTSYIKDAKFFDEDDNHLADPIVKLGYIPYSVELSIPTAIPGPDDVLIKRTGTVSSDGLTPVKMVLSSGATVAFDPYTGLTVSTADGEQQRISAVFAWYLQLVKANRVFHQNYADVLTTLFFSGIFKLLGPLADFSSLFEPEYELLRRFCSIAGLPVPTGHNWAGVRSDNGDTQLQNSRVLGRVAVVDSKDGKVYGRLSFADSGVYFQFLTPSYRLITNYISFPKVEELEKIPTGLSAESYNYLMFDNLWPALLHVHGVTMDAFGQFSFKSFDGLTPLRDEDIPTTYCRTRKVEDLQDAIQGFPECKYYI